MANTKTSLETFIELRKRDLHWFKERKESIESEPMKIYYEGQIDQLQLDLPILESILKGEM